MTPRPSRRDLALMIADWLRDDSDAFVEQRGESPTQLYVEGRLDLVDLAALMIDLLDACPCDCDDHVGRVQAGSFEGSGPLRCAYTCAAHKDLVMAWATMGTNLPATYISMEGLTK